MEDVTSICKSMIKRKDSIHKSSISNFRHKEYMYMQATRTFLMEMNEENSYNMKT